MGTWGEFDELMSALRDLDDRLRVLQHAVTLIVARDFGIDLMDVSQIHPAVDALRRRYAESGRPHLPVLTTDDRGHDVPVPPPDLPAFRVY